MREIKFRAWNGKKMLNNEDSLNLLAYLVKNVKYMQFIGRKDKNGNEIYEGDIVDTRYGRYVVEWNEGMCGFTPFCFCSNAPDPETETEIIGNRYQDPKLILELDKTK